MMISTQLEDWDIWVPESSRKMEALLYVHVVCAAIRVLSCLTMCTRQAKAATLAQMPELGLDLCQRTDQRRHAPGQGAHVSRCGTPLSKMH